MRVSTASATTADANEPLRLIGISHPTARRLSGLNRFCNLPIQLRFDLSEVRRVRTGSNR